MSCCERSGHIALLTHLLGGGGLAGVYCNLARAFVNLGFRVDLVLLEGRSSRSRDVAAGVRVVDLHTSRRGFRALPSVVRYLLKERPDAMISAVYARNLLALWARMITRLPMHIVVSEHNTLSAVMNERRSRTNVIAPHLIRWTFPMADAIVAVSEGVADDLAGLARLPRESIRVIHNPVIGPEFEALAATSVAHSWLRRGEAPVVIGMGRLSPQKNFASLIRAFARLRRMRGARLIILGEGAERQRLEQLVLELALQEDVDLPGYVPNPYAYMVRASVFVLSSLEEGFGNVLVEALACGCPVVSTDCPSGPLEILQNGRYGRLVPVGDEEALARAIAETLDHPPDKEMLKARGREFTVERSAAKYLELLGFGNLENQRSPPGRAGPDA